MCCLYHKAFRSFLISFLLLSALCKGQVYRGEVGRIPDNGTFVTFTTTVSDLPELNAAFGLEEVCILIQHKQAGDIIALVESPTGTVIELTSVNGTGTKDYKNTCFTNSASKSVISGRGPFTGKYKPEGFLGSFNNGQNPNGIWKLHIKDWKAFMDEGELIDWSIKFSNTPVKPLPFTNSNLPLVIINTQGTLISDSAKKVVNFSVINREDGILNHLSDQPVYHGKAKIELRGASSQVFPKKSYSITLVDENLKKNNVSLLGLPKEHDWILYAPFPDKSLIRNHITYELYQKMGNYASRSRMVEVIINNNYQGVYVLMEKLKKDPNRVNIAALKENDNDITGGYIIKLDKINGKGGGGWQSGIRANTPGNKYNYFQFEYPKDNSITPAQRNYIKAYIDSFENALFSENFKDPELGYKKFINLNSFLDYFLINELSKNVDGYRLSTFLYKDKDSRNGKLCIGPIWDFDLAWKNADFGNSFDPVGWQYTMTDSVYPSPLWWERFMQDDRFVSELHSRWGFLRETVLKTDSIFKVIDIAATQVKDAQARNFTVWPVMGEYIWPNPQPVAKTYLEEVDIIKKWVSARIAWMDRELWYKRNDELLGREGK